MLSYQLKNGRSASLHIGEKNDIRHNVIQEIDNVIADGDELEHIVINMEGVPYHRTKRVQIWYGDMAKFIVAIF